VRIIFILAALFLIFPGVWTDIGGLALAAVAYTIQIFKSRALKDV